MICSRLCPANRESANTGRIPIRLSPDVPAADWNDLQTRFRDVVQQGGVGNGHTASSCDVWRLVVSHPCYQRELDQRVRRLLFITRSPADWLSDIKHDVLLTFANSLYRQLEVNHRTLLVEEYFIAWLRCVIARDCRHAWRRMKRLFGQVQHAREPEDTVFDWPAIENALDLAAAIAELNESVRLAIMLRTSGESVQEIATTLRMSPRTTYRTLARALGQLRQRLGIDANPQAATASKKSWKSLARIDHSVP